MRIIAVVYVLEANDLDLPNEPVHAMITHYFVRDFRERFNLVQRLQSLDQARHPVWEQYYDRCIALHLGQLSNLFDEGQNENLIFNLDGTHFVLDHDDGKALGVLAEASMPEG